MASRGSERRAFHVSVVGLSGRDKGTQGVGKSCLCNRFLSTHADEFRTDHISEISESDFIGCVVNSKHFLYWGEVTKRLDDGQSAVFRVVEQTEFINDEKLSAFSGHSYAKRAVTVKLESKGKVRYISSDQMALPEEFEIMHFPDKFHVDGFLVVYDGSGYVDGRSHDAQKKVFSKLIPALVKTKKPVVVAATKCEASHETSVRETEALVEKLMKYPHFIETSAFEDVNVNHAFFTLAHLIERGVKTRCKITPFAQASRVRQQQLTDAKKSYQWLLSDRIGDFQTTWQRAQKMLQEEDAFRHYVQLQGMTKSRRPFLQHVTKLKEKKKEQKRSEHLTKIPKALAAILPKVNEDSTWLDCQEEMKSLKEFDQYFVILAEDSLWEDEDWLVSSDPRIPASILGLPEAETCFEVHKRDVIARQKRREMELHLREMLRDSKYSVLPGMQWSEVNDKLSLRDDYCPIDKEIGKTVWKDEGENFRREAKDEFYELLLESPKLFDFARTTDRLGDEMHFLKKALHDDLRYQGLQKLEDDRSTLIWNHIVFLQKEPLIDRRFTDVIDITKKRGSLMINSNMWNIKAGDTRLRLLLLGTDGLPQEVEEQILAFCSSEFEYIVDNARYSVETRIIDDQMVSSSNFASGEFTPTGCICVFSGRANLQYVYKALDGHILPSKSTTPLARLPFRGLPITLIQGVDPDMPEADQQEVAKDAVELANRLQCGVAFPKGQRADRQSVTSEQAAEAITALITCVKHRETFISVTKRVQPELRISMYVMDNDPYQPEQVLAPLICQQCCWRDPDHQNAVRFQVFLDNSYKCVEVILLSPQGVSTAKRKVRHGYILVYSAKRRASYNNMRALFDHLPAIPRVVLAVTDRVDVEAGLSDPQEDGLELKLLEYGNSLAMRTGSSFMTLSPHSNSYEGMFLPFFTEAWNKRYSSMIAQGSSTVPSPMNHRPPAPLPETSAASTTLSVQSPDSTLLASPSRSRANRHAYEEVDLPFERSRRMSPGPVEPVKKSPQHSTLFHYHDETDDTPVAADLSDSRLADSCSPSNIDTRPPAELPAQEKSSDTGCNINYAYAVVEITENGIRAVELDDIGERKRRADEPVYALPQNTVKGRKPVRVVCSKKPFAVSSPLKSPEHITSTPKSARPSSPVQDVVPRPEYGVVQDASIPIQQTDKEQDIECQSERQSLEKEPEAVQDSLKKTLVEKRDSKPESHNYCVQLETTDGPETPPMIRRIEHPHTYEEHKLETDKDKVQSFVTLSSGRTSPTLSDSTSDSESPLLGRRSRSAVMPPSVKKKPKLSVVSLPQQSSFDTDESGDEHNKKKTRRRVPSQGSIISAGEDYVLSPRAYRRFAIPTKLSESMLEIYRDDDEQLCVELVDSSVIRVRKNASGEFDNDLLPFLQSDKARKKWKHEEKERVKLEARRHKEQRKLEEKRRRDLKREEERLRKWRARSPAQQRLRGSPVSTYFGIELTDLPEIRNRGAQLPLFVAKCVKAIEKHGITMEGLYRVSGKKEVIGELKNKFENDHKLDFDVWAQENVHVLTTALKSFFQELPSPLIPESLIEPLCGIIVKPEFAEKIAELKEYLESSLPPLNYGVLRHIIQHLHRVKQHSEQNKMMASNLSVVFWPTLIRPNITDIDKLIVDRNQTTNLAEIVMTLIENSQYVFGEDDTPDAVTIIEIPTEAGETNVEAEQGVEATETDAVATRGGGKQDVYGDDEDDDLCLEREKANLSARRYTDL